MKTRNETWKPQWVALPIIELVRIVHEFGDDSEAAFAWLRKFANDLLFGNFDTEDDFARELLMDAREKYTRRSNAGKLGGRPPKNQAKDKSGKDLPTASSVYDFAEAEGLDPNDARDWYEMTIVDRGGLDRNGNPIENWNGAIKRFCKNRAAKRSKGEVK